jgi:uncharacterized membrane protein
MRPHPTHAALVAAILGVLAACEPGSILSHADRTVAANQVLNGTQGFDFTRIDAPGAAFTVGRAVNSGGAIAGWFFRSGRHGFLLSHGTFTQIDFNSDPNRNTTADGMNDAADIVGNYRGTDGQTHGYLLSGGTYTTIDPSGAVFTTARAINTSGDIVGFFFDNSGEHGFLTHTSNLTSFTTINFPDAVATQPGGINDAGDVVGSYVDASGRVHGFLLSSGRFTSFDVPGALFTLAWGINNGGQIVGFEGRGGIASLTEPVFPAPVADVHGYLLNGGPFIPVDVSGVGGGINTGVFWINSTGVIAGQYDGTDGATHAFVGVPLAVP